MSILDVFIKKVELINVNNNVTLLKNVKRAFALADEINKFYATSKIANNIFKLVKSSSLEIYNFYILDLIYVLESIVNNNSKKKKFTTLKTMNEILNILKYESVFKNTYLIESRKEDVKLDNIDCNFALKDYQEDFLRTYITNKTKYSLNGFMLAATAGSGKTATSLMLYQLLNKKRCVIISPLNAVNKVWVNHVDNKFFKEPRGYSTSLEKQNMDYNKEFIIIHYEYLNNAVPELMKYDHSDTLIIIDESHNFNEMASNRTKTLIDYCIKSKCKDVLLMSGTPIKALPTESIPLFRCIDPYFTENAMESFKRMYRSNNNKGTSILESRLGLVTFKVQKKELGLLDPIFINVKVNIPNGNYYTLDAIKIRMEAFVERRFEEVKIQTPRYKQLYNYILDQYSNKLGIFNSKEKEYFELYKVKLNALVAGKVDYYIDKEVIPMVNAFEIKILYPLYLELDKTCAVEWLSIRTAYKYPELKIRGECLGFIVGKARSDCHKEMVKHIDFSAICDSTLKKTVVFTSFVDVVEECNIHLPEIGLNNRSVYSKTNKSLVSIIDEFQNLENVNPLVATYKSLSTAVPLTMADTMILIDTPFRDYILQQAVSRIHRLDSDTQTTIYVIQLDTGDKFNISQRSKEILEWSQKQIKEIIGIESPFDISDDGAFTDSSLSLEGYEQDKPIWLNW